MATKDLKKKIGIAAVTYKENFGIALQTYATQYTLEKLGFDACIFETKLPKQLYFGQCILIAEDIICRNGVVFGAAYTSDLKVMYIGVDKKEDLVKF